MLRDPREVALNDVLVLIKDSAHHYSNAADALDAGALRTLFQRLAEERGEIASELEGHIRALNALPREPDYDREAFEDLATRLKANLSQDPGLALLAERQDAETELVRGINATLTEDIPAATRTFLERLHQHVRDVQQTLEARRTELAD